MKKVIKKSLVMVVMFSAMVSYANAFVNTDNEKDEFTNVKFTDVTVGSVLTIKEVNGIVLYKEIILKQGVYTKDFDLQALPDGDYLFELNKEFEIKVIPFNVSFNMVIIDKDQESVVFKPRFMSEDGMLKIRKLLLDKVPLKINIYDKSGELIYTEKYENKQYFSKTFDFSTRIKSDYRIVLYSENRSFEKEINI